jgi:hypothetical protein
MNFSPESSGNRHPNDHPIYKPGPHIEPKVVGYMNLHERATITPDPEIKTEPEVRLNIVRTEILSLLNDILKNREKFTVEELDKKEEDLIKLRIEETSLKKDLGMVKDSPVVLPEDKSKLDSNKKNMH